MIQDLVEDYIGCECSSPEHTIKLSFDPEYGELYMNIFLCDNVWYKRLWLGLKYIFGYKSKYGHFTEIVISKNKRDSLNKFSNLFKDYHDHLSENKQD